jgi:hypothetical protein
VTDPVTDPVTDHPSEPSKDPGNEAGVSVTSNLFLILLVMVFGTFLM